MPPVSTIPNFAGAFPDKDCIFYHPAVTIILLLFLPSICVALVFVSQLAFCSESEYTVDDFDRYDQDVESKWTRLAPSKDRIDEVAMAMSPGLSSVDRNGYFERNVTNSQVLKGLPLSHSPLRRYEVIEYGVVGAPVSVSIEARVEEVGESLPLVGHSVPDYGSFNDRGSEIQ